MNLDIDLVRTVLAGHSALYRVAESGKGNEDVYEIINDSEFRRVRRAYVEMALDPNTPPQVQERSQRWLLNEKKGRNNSAKLPGLAIGILQINQRLQEIESRKEKILNATPAPPVLENA